MPTWLRPIAVSCFALAVSAVAGAADLLRFDQPALGIPWNQPPEKLTQWMPGLETPTERSAVFRGPLQVGSFEFADRVLMLGFDGDRKLQRLRVQFSNTDAVRIVETLRSHLGPGRSASFPDLGMFRHVHEWRSPTYSVNFNYLSQSATTLAEPARTGRSTLALDRDVPERWQVDVILAFAKANEATRERSREMQLQHERRVAAEASPPRSLAAPINAAGQPPLPKAESTWGPIFNPAGDAPLDSFKAYYFDTDRPRTVVAQEQVADVAINYAWDQFHGIKSEQFGAYWVGRMQFKAPQTRLIGVGQSHAKTRIVIDGSVVYEGRQDARVPYEFSKGEHLIEVEHVNNWHTTELRVAFGKSLEKLSTAQVRAELERRRIENADVHYVGLYESSARDLTVKLDVAPLTRDTMLVLSSHSPVKWVVGGRGGARLRAIVLASSNPGSEVVGIDEKRTAVLPYESRIGSHTFKPTCHCTAGRYHCETSDNLLSTRQAVEDITHGRMVGFSGAYGAAALSIPDKTLTEETLEQSRQQLEADAVKRQQCEKKADPDFERMMK